MARLKANVRKGDHHGLILIWIFHHCQESRKGFVLNSASYFTP